MSQSKNMELFWRSVYIIYPPFIRFLEKVGLHNYRCNYHLGFLTARYRAMDLRQYLLQNGFEDDILAWEDPGEVLSLRKVSGKFQYHIRLFDDREIRAHYEFVPEQFPLGHIFVKHFVPEDKFFKSLLGDYLEFSADSIHSIPVKSGSN